MANNIEAERIKHLYDLLGTHHQRLALVEQERAKASPGEARAAMQLQISDIWDEIRGYEGELAELLSRAANEDEVPTSEATAALIELQAQVARLRNAQKPDWPAEVLAKLDDLETKLNEPSKAAAAKLKVSLPIVPTLISYEMELDTEATLGQVWRRITGLFRKAAPDPT